MVAADHEKEQTMPDVGTIWKNKETGDLVKVVSTAEVEDGGPCVVYHSQSGGVQNLTKTVKEFCEQFEPAN